MCTVYCPTCETRYATNNQTGLCVYVRPGQSFESCGFFTERTFYRVYGEECEDCRALAQEGN
ncbi:unnamed protein product [Fusarium graminearum]|nr:unnamed protein product [Fusarium graminearum]CAG1964636.1 unnamed protein product [Fusarium graminearum]CAG1964916.1 unnamed protein product [Fusarium graminearum]CAG1980520.1 unnamed protein product [Fusarium graminearum]CAG1999162.1 unnamed protein product [Fusarium graminearum]